MEHIRKRRLGSVVLALLLAAAPAGAVDLYGFGSYWDKGDAEGSWGYGIGLSAPLLFEQLKLDGRVTFYDDSPWGPHDELTLIPFDLGLQACLFPSASLAPYALAGLSYIYADAERTDVDSSFGGYLGGGLEWAPVSFLSLHGEVVYRMQEVDRGRGGNIDVSGITANLGVRLSF